MRVVAGSNPHILSLPNHRTIDCLHLRWLEVAGFYYLWRTIILLS